MENPIKDFFKIIAIESIDINDLLNNLKEVDPSYLVAMLKQRSTGGKGSVYDSSPSHLEEKLRSTKNWIYVGSGDLPNTKVWKADIGISGYLGIVPIDDDGIYTIEDPKNIGKVSLTIPAVRGPKEKYTYLITGKHKGKEVVFTFHPGEPIKPSLVGSTDLIPGTKISGEKAKEYGFEYAKIV